MIQRSNSSPEIFIPITDLSEYVGQDPETQRHMAEGVASINASLAAIEATQLTNREEFLAGNKVLQRLDPQEGDYRSAPRIRGGTSGIWSLLHPLPAVKEPDTGMFLRTDLKMTSRTPWGDQSQELLDTLQILETKRLADSSTLSDGEPHAVRTKRLYGVAGERRFLGRYRYTSPEALQALRRGVGQELLQQPGMIIAESSIVAFGATPRVPYLQERVLNLTFDTATVVESEVSGSLAKKLGLLDVILSSPAL